MHGRAVSSGCTSASICALHAPQAYQNYARTILTRSNTITGVLYKDNPTIMAIELAANPHTRCISLCSQVVPDTFQAPHPFMEYQEVEHCDVLPCVSTVMLPIALGSPRKYTCQQSYNSQPIALCMVPCIQWPYRTRAHVDGLPLMLRFGLHSTDLERVVFGSDIPPGTLITYWVHVNSKFIRSIDANHMVRPTALEATPSRGLC